MKISEILSRVENLKPNDFDESQKIAWLSTLDLQIKTEIIDTYEGAESIEFSGYDENTSKETQLLVSAPYDEMYEYYLCAKINYYNGEIKKYNTDMTMFNNVFSQFRAHYARTHKSKGVSKISYF